MNPEDLPRRQKQIYDFLIQHWQDAGFAPTQKDICDTTGVSLSQLNYSLTRLEKKGFIEYARFQARGVKPIRMPDQSVTATSPGDPWDNMTDGMIGDI